MLNTRSWFFHCCWLVFFSAAVSFADDFKLTSPQFKYGETLPVKVVFNSFGCKGENLSPELRWGTPPAGTKSLALTVYDPDAPTGSGWWHWTVINIPVTNRKLSLGETFQGESFKGVIQARTDYGKPGYGGPCPPEGDKPHRYWFTLFAIKDAKLNLDADASGAMVGYTLNSKMITKATLLGLYSRPGSIPVPASSPVPSVDQKSDKK